MTDLSETWRYLLRRGLELRRSGRLEEAAETLERAIRMAGRRSSLLAALGQIRTDQGRFAEAHGLLHEACNLAPLTAGPTEALARLLGLHLDRPDEALTRLEGLLPHTSGAPRCSLELVRGEIMLSLGHMEAAEASFNAALGDEVSGPVAQMGLARCANARGIALAEAGELEPAVFALKRAADLDPRWSSPCVNMGVVLGRMGKQALVLSAFADALEREPRNPVAYFNLGTTLRQMGQLEDAASALEDLLDLDPEFPQARVALANVLGELNRLEPARRLLEEELEEHPYSAACWSSLGLVHVCMDDPVEGERCLLKALELDPRHFNAIQNLINLYVTLQRGPEARTLLDRARMLDPGRTEQIVASGPQFEALSEFPPE